jgi:hypothetical protein
MKQVHVLVADAFLENHDGKSFVDHIDNDRSNNNISNLRWATSIENNRNAIVRKDNKSGVKGVHFDKHANKYKSQITIDGIKIHLGYFTKIEDAKQARISKANQAFGVFTNSCEKIISINYYLNVI